MPEGPSVKNWSTKAEKFIGRKIKVVDGNTHVVDKQALVGCTLSSVEAYGKQLFLCFSPCQTDVITKDSDTANQDKTGEHDTADCEKIWLRYHFLMWGSLRANELKGPSKRSKTQKIPTPRLLIRFEDDEFLAFYNGSVQYVEEPCPDNETDILKSNFDIEKATASVQSNRPVCYTLLDQKVFSGLGNIMKNEALYTSRLHPLEVGTDLTKEEAMTLVNEAVKFSAMWMEYEKNRVFKETWSKFSGEFQIYKKHRCPEGHKTKRDWFGDGLKRLTVWCPKCQPLKGEGIKDGKMCESDASSGYKGSKVKSRKASKKVKTHSKEPQVTTSINEADSAGHNPIKEKPAEVKKRKSVNNYNETEVKRRMTTMNSVSGKRKSKDGAGIVNIRKGKTRKGQSVKLKKTSKAGRKRQLANNNKQEANLTIMET